MLCSAGSRRHPGGDREREFHGYDRPGAAADDRLDYPDLGDGERHRDDLRGWDAGHRADGEYVPIRAAVLG